jgi:hypothetical protein
LVTTAAVRRSALLARLLGGLGLFLLLASSLLTSVSRGLFVAGDFANRAASSLGDERVSRFVATRIADKLIAERPDLTAVRPLIVGTANELVRSDPFRAVARTALRSAHEAFFSRGGQEFLLSVPDAGILLQGALAEASPRLAARIPAALQTLVARLPKSRIGSGLVVARKIWSKVRWLQRGVFVLACLLLLAGIAIHPHRRVALMRAGFGLVGVALLLTLTIPAGRVVALVAVHDPAARSALVGIWRAYFLPVMGFAYTIGGTGLILAAAANSMLELADPHRRIRELVRLAGTPPAARGARIAWILGMAGAGSVLLAWPSSVVVILAVGAGLLLLFDALRELFRLLLERVPAQIAPTGPGAGRGWPLRGAAVAVMATGLVAALVLWRRSVEPPPPTSGILACNGAPQLCSRRIDQVSFPATHNSMSNAQIPGWMFPNQGLAFVPQLEMGIRALLIDIHYGFPGGSRIKTDLQDEGATREKLVEAVGEEGFAAAERIRNRLVGVDEGKRGLYFCHGFCELGAYAVAPALEQIRAWLVQNPGEVILVVIEDYVTPQEIAQAFQASGLESLVYTGPITPWPTLGAMVEANQRVLVFTESGKPGVAWLHPAFASFQETPYTFHSPAEFSCRPNRGGTSGTLFQVNHWIETTPAPRPSNAEIVNTYAALMKRARTCQRERGLKPTYLAVDFGEIGEIVQATRTLNGLDTAGVRAQGGGVAEK